MQTLDETGALWYNYLEASVWKESGKISSTTSEPNYLSKVILHNESYIYFEPTFFDFSQIRV